MRFSDVVYDHEARQALDRRLVDAVEDPLAQELLDNLDEQIERRQRNITAQVERWQERDWNLEDLEEDPGNHRRRLSELQELRVRFLLALPAENQDEALLLANIVKNEAGAYGNDAQEAIAYAWLNHTGGDVREPVGEEISHYRPLQQVWEGKEGHAEQFQFFESFVPSLETASARLADSTPADNDPTDGATHWVSPRALPDYNPNDPNHEEERYPRTFGRYENKGFPNWAAEPGSDRAAQLRQERRVDANYDEFTIPNVPGETFLFYRGVR